MASVIALDTSAAREKGDIVRSKEQGYDFPVPLFLGDIIGRKRPCLATFC